MQSNTEVSKLLELADRYCIATGGSEEARAQWRIDIEQTPPHLYQGLRAHFQTEMPAPTKLPAPPKRVPATAALAWPKADKADQAHFWGCIKCRTGNKCAEGQRLNDLYMEVALREGRLVATRCAPKKTTVHWSVHAAWRQADRDYEGGNYLAQGVWRATKTSKMDNLGQPFNAPQKEAFVLAFYDAIGDYLHIDNSIPGLFVAAVPDPSKVHKAWAANHVASGSYGTFYDAYALGTYQSGTAIEVITTDSSGYVRKGLERTQQQKTVQIGNAAITHSANATYTLNTSDTVLCMDAKDSYITLAQGCARNYIDGGAGSDTLVLSGLSANFMLQKLDTGTTVFFDKTGLLSLAATNVEQVQFADKAVALSDLGSALTIASALPAVAAHLPPSPSAENPVAAWMQAPAQPFPTSQFVALFFERVWQREATMADTQFWENFVSDYIQQPGQIANVVGLIHANADALLA